MVDQSFRFETGSVIGVKKDLASRQFVMKIWEYFSKLELVKVQILNRRFYLGITPHWLDQVKVNKTIKQQSITLLSFLSDSEHETSQQVKRYNEFAAAANLSHLVFKPQPQYTIIGAFENQNLATQSTLSLPLQSQTQPQSLFSLNINGLG